MKRSILVLAVPVVFLLACLFTMSTGKVEATSNEANADVTYSKDVAPIFYKNCTGCHRPAEMPPMVLLTYKEARPWAKSIREKVASREMPPWHADPNHGEWLNDRRLTQAEISTIVGSVDGGAMEGDPKDLPQAPKFADGWTIGRPDETFSIPEQSIPATGVVPYKYLTVPTNLKEDRWITDAEIRSTGRSAMHHVIVFIQDPKNPTTADGNLLAGGAPGGQPARYPPRLREKIPAGAKLIFQMHYTPNGEATKDVTTIGLKYATKPRER